MVIKLLVRRGKGIPYRGICNCSESLGVAFVLALIMLRMLSNCALVCSFAILSADSKRDGVRLDLDKRPHRKTLPASHPPPHRRQKLYRDNEEKLYLTPYIVEEKYEVAKQLAKVENENIKGGLESYAGYITVNSIYNSNLWFWYFPAHDVPVGDTPLIIWLEGGPGTSSLQGLFNEIGPFSISSSGDEIIGNKYSWGNNHSLLFIDNPVGAGYSFSDDIDGYATNQDTIGSHLHLALKQFLKLFSELQPAPLILVGEGYGGKHVTSLAMHIHRHRNASGIPINLQGIVIGNGLIDPPSMVGYSEFARQTGLVDNDVADELRAAELIYMDTFIDNATLSSFLRWEDLLKTLIKESYLGNVFNFLDDDMALMEAYLDNEVLPYERLVQEGHMRNVLHVSSTEFGPMREVLEELKPDLMNSVKPWLEELLEHYRVLCYSGQMDILVTYRMSVEMYESLHWSGREEYQRSERKLWYHKGRLAGYHKSAGKFTEVLVRDAGHMVPADQPDRALALISTFARNVTLDADTGLSYVVKGKDSSAKDEEENDKVVLLIGDDK